MRFIHSSQYIQRLEILSAFPTEGWLTVQKGAKKVGILYLDGK